MVEGFILGVLVGIDVEPELPFVADTDLVIELQQCVEVIPGLVFKIDLYPLILGDQAAGHERNFTQVVIDDVILVFSPKQQFSIYKYPFTTGQYNEKLLPVFALQFIRSLVALYALEYVPGKLPFGHRPAEADFVFYFFVLPEAALVLYSLHPFVEVQEIGIGFFNIIIPQR